MPTHVRQDEKIPRYALRKTSIMTAERAFLTLHPDDIHPFLFGMLTPFEAIALNMEYGLRCTNYDSMYCKTEDGIGGLYPLYFDFSSKDEMVDFIWANTPPEAMQ